MAHALIMNAWFRVKVSTFASVVPLGISFVVSDLVDARREVSYLSHLLISSDGIFILETSSQLILATIELIGYIVLDSLSFISFCHVVHLEKLF